VTAIALDAAVGARALIERAGVFADVPAAVADLTHVFATTARERGQAKPVVLPEAAVADAAARVAGGGRVGVLFGPERTGLTSEEVAAADAIVTFPVDPAHPSVNLAQSVALIAYLFGRAALPPPARPADPPATDGMKQAFFATLVQELEVANYFLVPDKEAIMRRNLLNIFRRMDLSEGDVRTLMGAVVALAEGRRKRGARPSGAGER
jgi:tRNA/rRNA methyltransferase